MDRGGASSLLSRGSLWDAAARSPGQAPPPPLAPVWLGSVSQGGRQHPQKPICIFIKAGSVIKAALNRLPKLALWQNSRRRLSQDVPGLMEKIGKRRMTVGRRAAGWGLQSRPSKGGFAFKDPGVPALLSFGCRTSIPRIPQGSPISPTLQGRSSASKTTSPHPQKGLQSPWLCCWGILGVGVQAS